MRALTDAELAALILEAVKAERWACASAVRDAAQRCVTIADRSIAFGCYLAVMERGMPGFAEPPLILEAVKAERAACALACVDVAGQFLEPKKAVAWLCYSAIRDRDLAGYADCAGSARIDGTVSKPDTAQHETPTSN